MFPYGPRKGCLLIKALPGYSLAAVFFTTDRLARAADSVGLLVALAGENAVMAGPWSAALIPD